ncbi:MAG: SGNH/GDSL hydrolase family protein [Microbacterium sp.]
MSVDEKGRVVAGGSPAWGRVALPKDAYDWVRFTRLENVPMLARRSVPVASQRRMLAELAGISEPRLDAALEAVEHELSAAAEALCRESAEAVARLAATGERIVAVGDSITADRVSWAEIIGRSVARTPGSSTVLVNRALAATTSTDTLERLDLIIGTEPDLVVLMIGTNDVRSQRALPGEPLVSSTESRRNVRLLVDAIAGAGSKVLLVTPPPLDDRPSRIGLAEQTWENAWDEAAIVAAVEATRDCPAPLVDLRDPEVFDPTDATFMDPDGIHPTIAGHVRIARRVLQALDGDGYGSSGA